jgi:geranylgeranyl diphosphate synthase, type II
MMKKKPEKSFDLPAYLAGKRRIIDDRLESLLDEYSITTDLYHAMYYSLMNPGKRLRPILCIAAAEAVGAVATEQVMRAACAIEMIHTYSLIHDDLPSMDDDDMRRGKPTCHVKFNEATAILAGDALLTLAFEVLSDAAASPENMTVENMSRQLTLISKIAMAAGNRGMIEGQMLDIAAQGKPTDLKALKLMHNLKTGAIIEAAVAAGAISGGATDAQIEALSVYARSIGLAFQVTDDILNVEGDPEIMGKSTGTDRLRKKATYPALIGLAESKKYAIELVSIALQSLAIFDNKAVPLFSIAQYIIERKR